MKKAIWLLMLIWIGAFAAPPVYPPVLPGRPLSFPRDLGAHPAYRTEWWYVTGWLDVGKGKPLGFQVTFFRTRPDIDQADPSRFAPKQLLFAHVALSDPAIGHLLHEQRAARAGFGLAYAKTGDTDVAIDDWSLARDSDGSYRIAVRGRELGLRLVLRPTQPPLPEGDAGYSRKGPKPEEASYYYSQPQLEVRGTVSRDGRRLDVTGTAWLDHEWSTAMLAKNAVGWDWTGINLDDGGALMAFRIRDAAGHALWSRAKLRRADGSTANLSTVSFAAIRLWRSPRTEAEYPVAMHVAAGPLAFDLTPLFDDQELDARASTGNVYWEGAVTATAGGKRIGRGYLELTGYYRPIRLHE